MISQARGLQDIPAAWDVLRKPSIRFLYSSICGALYAIHIGEQDRTYASLIACYSLEEKVIQFVQAREQIEEYNKETCCWLWELKFFVVVCFVHECAKKGACMCNCQMTLKSKSGVV